MLMTLYQTVSGSNGRADIYEVTHHLLPPGPCSPEQLDRAPVAVVVYEVRFGSRRASCIDEKEAAALAATLAGCAFIPPASMGMD